MHARVAIVLALTGLTTLAAGLAAEPQPKAATHTGEFTEPAFAERWGYGATDQAHPNVVVSDAEMRRAGTGSVKLDTGSGLDTWLYFPDTKDLDIDATQCTALHFWLRTENQNGWGGDPWVILRDADARGARYDGTMQRLKETLKDWVEFTVPVDPAATDALAKAGWKLALDAGFDWKHIAAVEVHADTGGYGFMMYLDDMQFVPAAGQPAVSWRLTSLERPDLTVTWAEQVPAYHRYEVDYSKGWPELKAGTKKLQRWPNAGEEIKYVVHVRNVGRVASPETDFVCAIDGQKLATDKVPALKLDEEVTITVPWKWQAGAHAFEARVDTPNRIDEISERNNLLAFQTDAYTLRATVEKGCYEKVSQVNNRLGSFSFEDWLRASTVDQMNEMMQASTYDFAPQGAKTRVRIGRILYVDKIGPAAERLIPADATDGGWNYPTGSAVEYCNLANTYMWALCHELTHQLGIIDDYQLDLSPQNNTVNAQPFKQPDGGSMGGGRTNGRKGAMLADMDVAGLNATYGKRRGYFGEYLYCVPLENTVELLIDGKPLAAGTEISVYQKKFAEGPGVDGTGNGTIPQEPIAIGKATAGGRLLLPNRPVRHEFTTETGCTLHPNPFGHIDVVGRNGLLMFRAEVGGQWYYAFMDIGLFNVEYARGNTKSATHKLTLAPEVTAAKPE
ncbi:MAG: hypothetical protein JXO22_05655 [Phycisphaerae bacterium]|nr:hypothetical protein [Phycisphaerae bacterium]